MGVLPPRSLVWVVYFTMLTGKAVSVWTVGWEGGNKDGDASYTLISQASSLDADRDGRIFRRLHFVIQLWSIKYSYVPTYFVVFFLPLTLSKTMTLTFSLLLYLVVY